MLCDTDGISVPITSCITSCISAIPSVSLVLSVSRISSVASVSAASVFAVSGVPGPLSSDCNATSMILVAVVVSLNVVLFVTSSSGMHIPEIDLQSDPSERAWADPSERAWASNRESYHITSPLEVCIVIPVPFFSGWIRLGVTGVKVGGSPMTLSNGRLNVSNVLSIMLSIM